MIWDTTCDIRFQKKSPILYEKILKHGEMVWKKIKIGPRLSKPTLAEELAACDEVSAFSDKDLQSASTPSKIQLSQLNWKTYKTQILDETHQ